MARRKSLSVLSLGIGGYFTIRRTRYDSHCYDSVRLHEDRRDPTPHGGTQLELLLSMSLLYVYVLGYSMLCSTVRSQLVSEDISSIVSPLQISKTTAACIGHPHCHSQLQ